eukprot:4508751-Prymnesium_polylepis.1
MLGITSLNLGLLDASLGLTANLPDPPRPVHGGVPGASQLRPSAQAARLSREVGRANAERPERVAKVVQLTALIDELRASPAENKLELLRELSGCAGRNVVEI